MGVRRKSRELALQYLYGHDLRGAGCEDQELERGLAAFQASFTCDSRALDYGREIVRGICGCRRELDKLVEKHAHNWRLSRMSAVDRNILRIAAWEILHADQVPVQVAINEALEIAKRYSTADAIPFINGILDSLKDEEPAH